MELFFGIDVGKFRFDIHVNDLNQSFSVSNDKVGLKELIKKINGYLKDGHFIKLAVCSNRWI